MSTAPANLDLPPGWDSEIIAGSGKSLLSLKRPGSGGFVTIDFDRRIFAGGFGRPAEHLKGNTRTYEGRGWKELIVQDAITWLDGVMQ